MKITVFDAGTNHTRVFEGTPEELIVKLDSCYKWLSRYKPKDLNDRIGTLRNHQMLFLEVTE